MTTSKPLTPDESALYDWQLDVPGFGRLSQEKLKGARVLVSRCGGVGGVLAQQLTVAGVGKLVLAHAGNLRANDLNRQILMQHSGIGRPRLESACRRLRELNPYVELVPIAENVSEENVRQLVSQVDLVASCAPLFQERLLMNRAAVEQGKPLVDCAMYELTAQVVTVVPGQSACLACLYPELPPHWRRQFPVLGAVAGWVGCLGALEVLKLLTGFAEPAPGTLLLGDLRELSLRKLKLPRRADCAVCATRV